MYSGVIIMLSFLLSARMTLQDIHREPFRESKDISLEDELFDLIPKSECIPKVTLHNCNTKMSQDPKWIWRRIRKYDVGATVIKGCESSTIKMKWALYDESEKKYLGHFPRFQNKPAFVLGYYSLDTGTYVLKLRVAEVDKSRTGKSSSKCLIRIKPEDPLSKINGGNLRSVAANTPFALSGEESLNNDVRPGEPAYLLYKWRCTHGPSSLCNNKVLSEANKINIAGHPKGTEFNFSLSVSSYPSRWVFSFQIIKVKEKPRPLFITCLKNCKSTVNYREVLYLKVNCKGCSDVKYEWSVQPGPNNKKTSLDFVKETAFGRSSLKLLVKERIMVPGDVYTFTVTDGLDGEAALTVTVNPNPKAGECSIDPKSGESLTSTFTISCKDFQDPDPLIYHLFQEDLPLATNEQGKFNVMLYPGEVKLIVRAENPDGLYAESEITASVASSISKLPQNERIKKVLEVYEGHKGVANLVARGETERAVQIINAAAIESKQISKEAEGFLQFKKNLEEMTTRDLNGISWETQHSLLQVAITVKNLDRSDEKTVDREFSKMATEMCYEIATKQLEDLKNVPDKIKQSRSVNTLSQELVRCAGSNLKENKGDLKPDVNIFDITTSFPVVALPVIAEDYPNYDDANIERALRLLDYRRISHNAMEILSLTGKALSATLATGEPITKIDYVNILQAVKEEGQIVPNMTFEESNIVVQPSKNLENLKETPVEITVVTYKKSPFWWDPQGANFSGRPVHVQYFVHDETFDLKKRTRFMFKVEKVEPVLINASVSVPADVTKWSAEVLSKQMRVHRVNVIKGASLKIEFNGLKGQDKIQVVVTQNKRPNLEDFKKAKVLISGKATILEFFHPSMLQFGDAWFYVAVLPDKSMVKGKNDNFEYGYNVSFISSFCAFWDGQLMKWDSRSCRVLKTMDNNTAESEIACECIHKSVFSANMTNAPNKIDVILEIPTSLRLDASTIIFACVCLIFGVYCITLTFVAISKEAKEGVFFIGDNVISEQYAYLLTVKTGKQRSASTTSNIGIKIFGKKFNSKAHIVNYPDPDKNLLQRGRTDRFILVAEKHLGEINNIYLWHDSVGLKPSWYCEWILITDLQTNKEWYFDVEKWLSVLKDEMQYISIEPLSKVPVDLEVNSNKRHFPYLDQDLLDIEHITIILSIVLTTYIFSLAMYGIPKLRLYDGLSYGHFSIYPFTFFVAFISSILSFFLNLVFVHAFKKAHQNKNLKHLKFSWISLCTFIATNLTLLIIAGFWVAYVTSLLWLFSTVGALLQTILLTEHVYVHIKKFLRLYNFKSTKDPKESSPIGETEMQRRELLVRLGNGALRPYLATKYHPLTREEKQRKMQKELNRQNISQLVLDLVMFSAYIFLLYVVLLANRDSWNVYSNKNMKTLLTGEHIETANFGEIEDLDSFYEFVNETFIPTIHSSNWYGSFEMVDPGLMLDFNTKIIGVPRIRQLRVQTRYCYENINLRCIDDFSKWNNDRGKYVEFWKLHEFAAVPRLKDVWIYITDAAPSIGELTVYPGTGYSGSLGRTMYNSYYNLRYYYDTEWVDERARVISIEFLGYNVNYNVFHAVTLLVERSASGLFIKTLSVHTTRLLFVNLELELMLTVCFTLFIAMSILMFCKGLLSIAKLKTEYFKQVWNVIDVAILTMSFACVGLFICRIRSLETFLDQIETNKKNAFISYHSLIQVDDIFTVLAAVLICVSTVRLWKLLRFGVMFRIMERTLLLSAEPLAAVFIIHLILIVMFGFYGFVLFSSTSFDFRTLTATTTTLILLSLNLYEDFDYKYWQNFPGGIGYAYYTSYMLLTMIIFTLYVAVIVLSYTESRNFFSNLKSYYTVQKYIKDESRYFKELFRKQIRKIRLAAGGDSSIPHKTYPKSEPIRYADSVRVSEHRVTVMSLIARCVAHNLRKDSETVSEEELDLMRRTVSYIFQKEIPSSTLLGFVVFDKKIPKIISNERVLQMERIVNNILDAATLKNMQIERFENETDPLIYLDKTHTQLQYFQDVLETISSIFDNIIVE